MYLPAERKDHVSTLPANSTGTLLCQAAPELHALSAGGTPLLGLHCGPEANLAEDVPAKQPTSAGRQTGQHSCGSCTHPHGPQASCVAASSRQMPQVLAPLPLRFCGFCGEGTHETSCGSCCEGLELTSTGSSSSSTSWLPVRSMQDPCSGQDAHHRAACREIGLAASQLACLWGCCCVSSRRTGTLRRAAARSHI